jgi:uncharacterized membrane protein
MLIRSLIYGLLGWVIEIIWTALPKRRPVDWRLTGHTYLWMLPIYALIGPLYEPIHQALRRVAWPLRAVVYAAGFISVETITGLLLKRLIGRCPWDYTGDTRWQVGGVTRFDYAPLWAALGLGLEPVHDRLVQLTPAIEAALKADNTAPTFLTPLSRENKHL